MLREITDVHFEKHRQLAVASEAKRITHAAVKGHHPSSVECRIPDTEDPSGIKVVTLDAENLLRGITIVIKARYREAQDNNQKDLADRMLVLFR